MSLEQTRDRLKKCEASTENGTCKTGFRKCALYTVTRVRENDNPLAEALGQVAILPRPDFHIACGDENGYNGYQKNGADPVTGPVGVGGIIYMNKVYVSGGGASYADVGKGDATVTYYCCPECD